MNVLCHYVPDRQQPMHQVSILQGVQEAWFSMTSRLNGVSTKRTRCVVVADICLKIRVAHGSTIEFRVAKSLLFLLEMKEATAGPMDIDQPTYPELGRALWLFAPLVSWRDSELYRGG